MTTDAEEERIEPQPHVAANIDAIAGMVEKNSLIDKAEERAAKARGELGRHYQKIENDYHGNRKAVKLIRTLIGGTIDAAYDFMRTFMPLAERFDLIPSDDLADMMEKSKGANGPGEGEGTIDFGARRRRGGGAAAGKSALDRAKEHLEGGERMDEAAAAAAERQRTHGFDPDAPPGEPGDADLARGPGEEAPAPAASAALVDKMKGVAAEATGQRLQ